MLNFKSYLTIGVILVITILIGYVSYKFISLTNELHEVKLKNKELDFMQYACKNSLEKMSSMLNKQNKNIQKLNDDYKARLEAFNKRKELGSSVYDHFLKDIRSKNSLEEKLEAISNLNLKDL